LRRGEFYWDGRAMSCFEHELFLADNADVISR